MYSKNKYITGSLAEQVKPDIYEENIVLRQIKNKKRYRRNNSKLIFTISLFTMMLGLVVYRYSYVTELNYSLESAKVELNEITNKNSLLKVDIEKGLNLNAIRKEAKNKFKMHSPKENQKVYVRIHREDISVADEVVVN